MTQMPLEMPKSRDTRTVTYRWGLVDCSGPLGGYAADVWFKSRKDAVRWARIMGYNPERCGVVRWGLR